MNFKNKTVLITGGSRGIGRAIAIAFSELDATVIFTYHSNEKEAQKTLELLKGKSHLMIRSDVADPAAGEKVVNTIVEKFGRLDILVNNAGIYMEHTLPEVDFETWKAAWDKILGVNLLGPAHLCFFAGKQMIKQGGGKIINISSRGAFRGEPEYPAYGASKAGLNSMSQSLAQLLGPHNIYVGVIAPGFVETDMGDPFLNGPEGDKIRNQSPLKRAAKPEEIAHAVIMFATEGAEYMTGAIIDVNGASYLRS
jgi:3-oxoacyl-[acyl-carrier protein] reductase